MMKKVLAILLALAMVLSMAACGTEKKQEEKKEEGEDLSKYVLSSEEQIEFEFWYSYSNKKRAEWLEQKAADFCAAHPNVKITCVCTGGHPATAEGVAGALSAGTGLCAVSTMNAPRVQVYAQNGVAEPLDNYFKANEFDVSEYYDGMIDAATYDADGQIYGIPFGVSGGVCNYNETVTEAAGAKIPETWDEFKEWCEKVTAYTGQPAFAFPYDFNFMNTFFLNVCGVDPLGDGKTSKLDDPAIVNFMMEVRDLIAKGQAVYMGAKVGSALNDMVAAFTAQQISGYTAGSTDVVKADQAGKDAGFKVAYRIGVGNNGNSAITTVSGAYLVIYADETQVSQQQKNAAVLFAMYVSDAENHAEWANDTLMFPVRKATSMAPLLEKYPEMEPVFGHVDRLVTKNKVSCMQSAMEAVVGVFGEIVKGEVAEADINARWATLKTEIDAMLADAQ